MDHMAAALDLARAQAGRTGPNPSVGCVLVRDGVIIGQAATADGGRPHAETQALAMTLDGAGERARGAHAFVTLEPCAHHGVTPPCADALIRAGVASVTIGMIDPDSRTRWQGAARLQEAGIDTRLDLREAIADFYRDYSASRLVLRDGLLPPQDEANDIARR